MPPVYFSSTRNKNRTSFTTNRTFFFHEKCDKHRQNIESDSQFDRFKFKAKSQLSTVYTYNVKFATSPKRHKQRSAGKLQCSLVLISKIVVVKRFLYFVLLSYMCITSHLHRNKSNSICLVHLLFFFSHLRRLHLYSNLFGKSNLFNVLSEKCLFR